MKNINNELRELSVGDLLVSSDMRFQVPIYQRNYAWQKDEITALVQDVYDALQKNKSGVYFIGTLVTHSLQENEFEVIDGQQRLTTILILLRALNIQVASNKLSFKARPKSNSTIRLMTNQGANWVEAEDIDKSILQGYKFAVDAISDVLQGKNKIQEDKLKSLFAQYLQDNVHIIHYRVPQDIDLNHYFEVMNSRGEQLEKHEIVKAKLMSQFVDEPQKSSFFAEVWESCSRMNCYVQSVLPHAQLLFGEHLDTFVSNSPEDLWQRVRTLSGTNSNNITLSIADCLSQKSWVKEENKSDFADRFQPIIDFPNFLLIVLKVVQMNKAGFSALSFKLDDKELLTEFDYADVDANEFCYYLMKAKYLLDNYVVHHANEEETENSNPWKLQLLRRENKTEVYPVNVADDQSVQLELVHLLSMLEVSFSARQRKNYLFYIMLYLMPQESVVAEAYLDFLRNLSSCYFENIYLEQNNLTSRNMPAPGAFDSTILQNGCLNIKRTLPKSADVFDAIYGDGTEISKGIPLFVFNYLDYRIWKLYADMVRGSKSETDRQSFFRRLGCKDFGLEAFDKFYFSRTRRTLEHYYAHAFIYSDNEPLTVEQINCFGNYAMIGSEANSSGSNWSPHTKIEHYLDKSGKINLISVASLKLMIMMNICEQNNNWRFEEIVSHQKKMLNILFPAT